LNSSEFEDELRSNASFIVNKRPLEQESSIYTNDATAPSRWTYTVVDVIPNLNNTGWVLFRKSHNASDQTPQAAIIASRNLFEIPDVIVEPPQANGDQMMMVTLIRQADDEASNFASRRKSQSQAIKPSLICLSKNWSYPPVFSSGGLTSSIPIPNHGAMSVLRRHIFRVFHRFDALLCDFLELRAPLTPDHALRWLFQNSSLDSLISNHIKFATHRKYALSKTALLRASRLRW
jgi:hypothetical protein